MSNYTLYIVGTRVLTATTATWCQLRIINLFADTHSLSE